MDTGVAEMPKLFKTKLGSRGKVPTFDPALDPPVNPPWIVIREETEKSYNKELDKYLKLGYTIYSTHVKEAFNLYTAMLVRLG